MSETTQFHIEIGSRDASPAGAERAARFAAEAGFGGLQLTELQHDPFVACALAAREAQRAGHPIRIATSIAVAFARNPMTVAVAANDLQLASDGRFALGLGSQVQAHIERRFSMPWSAPAPRMREFIGAVRAIWHSWETGEKLDFRGEHYSHTLMTPMFSPGPNPHGNPPIWLAGVGAAMTRLAGEAADGFVAHAFTTREYLAEVSVPALAAGRARGSLETPIELVALPFVIVGSDPSARAAQEKAVRQQIAFYGSTPSYRGVMELHGWEAAADAMHAASKRGEWREMSALVTDEMLDAFAVWGTPAEVRTALRSRYAGLATTVCINAPEGATPDDLAALAR
ncbi:TIGR03617 family F420-dependent LLM class oxidoreductase [Microbacterium stercoris]|uniref:TIGR03617 family F420-dependent LLM class oxidoreductase n=1 Tax=Microbacterium stercoris TaxID=2820289 RepID=A0A939QQ26_9MICO|nr:TIGR03617 family F420-dependent LLM class oxidoreductase [Microbacterium stercoris]MBO3662576.1 TIGR03617 family F420-dependent LLM class oxidoreductase [Microbacterium stercoris]